MSQTRAFFFAITAMCLAVVSSNILVQYPVNWGGLGTILTYGAFTYPFAFLINDLVNRRFGPRLARHVVYVGFIAGLLVSWWLASPRLAIASGSAFLAAQLMDIAVFSPLRRKKWWIAPLCAAIAGSILDTIMFFAIAFAPQFAFLDLWVGAADGSIADWARFLSINMPVWLSLAFGDFCVKIIMAVLMLGPYGAILALFMPSQYQPR